MQVGLAHEIFFVLLAAFIGGMIFRLLKLAPLIGYIVGGIVFGAVLGIQSGQIAKLAEVGIILLLFSTGLELSISKLSRVAKIAVIGAVLQMIIVTALMYLILSAFGILGLPALILAFGFSLSSTAIVVKILSERGETDRLHGEIMIGWSLVQDLSVIPVMVLLPIVANAQGQGVFGNVLLACFKSIAVIAGTFFLGKYAAPLFIHKIASVNSRELLILSAVILAFGTAALTSLFGISPALGAFLAGVIISESQENHAVFAETRPLRDLFTALFFVTLGFFVTPKFIIANIGIILLLFIIVTLIKFIVIFFLTLGFKYHGKTAVAVGLGLSQVGEFAFVLFSQATLLKIFGAEIASIGIATALLSLIATPFLFNGITPFWKWLRSRLGESRRFNSVVAGWEKSHEANEKEFADHIIICGYGRVGGWVGKALESFNIPFVVVDFNQDVVSKLKKRGINVIYGDPVEKEVIEAAGIKKAKAVVLAIPDELAQEEIVAYIKNVNPQLKIISRVHKDEDWEKLKLLKVTKMIQPEFEGAISIVRTILSSMGKSRIEINERTKKLRQSHAMI